MFFKKRISKLINLVKILKNPEERRNYIHSKMTLKNFIYYGILTNVVSTFILIPIFNDSYINLSYTRFVSRTAGKIGDFTLPTFLRSHVLNAYIKFYNVDRDEILDQDLNNYKTVKEFFIRKIKV